MAPGWAGLGLVGPGLGGPWTPQGSQAAPLCPSAGVNIGGAGSYIYDKPQIEGQTAPGPIEHPVKVEERKVNAAPPKGPSKGEGQGRTSRTGPLPCWAVSAQPPCLVMLWLQGVVCGVLPTWLRCPPTSQACVLFSSSLQCHHLHRGAQHVPTLWQEGLFW